MSSAPSPSVLNLDSGALRDRGWALLLLLLAVALIYWPGLHGGYVFDDFPNIINNTALHVTRNATWPQWLAAVFSSPASDLQRPLAMLSFAINHALTGLDPYWMKLTNLGIHLLNTILVFGLVRRVLQIANAQTAARRDWTALWVAAAWALNPINLMAVLFVVQRMESLSHTFVFSGLWLYLVGRQRLRTKGHGWVPLLAGLIGGSSLGLLVKESAVLLPLYAFTLEWALLRFSSHEQMHDRRLLGVFAVLLALPGVIGLAWMAPKVLHVGAYDGRNFNLVERLLTEARVLVDYIHWTALPDLGQLSLYHDDYPVSQGLWSPPTTLFSILLLLAMAATALWQRKQRPVLALGLAWFLAAHALTATVWPLELMFEHRNYFASLGLCMALADLLLRAPHSQTMRRAGITTGIALLVLYSGETMLRAREWSDQLRFSQSEAAKHPQSPRATYDLARNLVILSNFEPDSPYFNRALVALDGAMGVPESTALPESAAILLAARSKQPIKQAWWNGLQRKLRTGPIGLAETNALAALVDCELKHYCQLPQQDMVGTFRAALEHGPTPELLSIYGNYALNVMQDPTLAFQQWQEAARIAPNVVQYQATLAQILIAIGRVDEARTPIMRVRQLGRLGQNEALAAELERLAKTASEQGTEPAVTPPNPDRRP